MLTRRSESRFVIGALVVGILACATQGRTPSHEERPGYAAQPAAGFPQAGGGGASRAGKRFPLGQGVNDDVRITASDLGISENSIAVHPLDGNVLLCANNSFHPLSFRHQNLHVAWSHDAGATWTSATIGRAKADPAVAIDRDGTFYVSYINDAAPVGEGGHGISVSSDGGRTWQPRMVFDGHADKNHLVVDTHASSPFVGRLHAGWTRFTSGGLSSILASFSDDGGRSWSPVRNVSRNQLVNQGVNLQTGPNGELYCCWSIFSEPEHTLVFSASLDGGNTFQAPRFFEDLRGVWPSGVTDFLKANSWPSMAVDRSGGPRNGWIYVFWTNVGVPGVNVGDPDIYMLRSRDGGETWDAPVRVNDDDTSSAQWFAWSACDQVNGDLYTIFYDRREDPADVLARAWVARSTDGGASWVNQPVGDEQFLPRGALGDYLGICARDGHVWPLWSDLRTDPVTAYTSPLSFDIHPPLVSCPEPLTVEGSTTGGAAASSPAIDAFLGETTAKDEVDPAPEIVSDAPAFFPLGTTLVTFTARDDAGHVAQCTAPLTVVDTVPPAFEVTPSLDVLAPADHRLEPIDVTAFVADVVDPDAGFVLASVGSSEADSGLGAGDVAKDIQQVELGTPDTRFLLRAESFSRGGRVYTLKYVAGDSSGNERVHTLSVRVNP
jgi:hypothetical protein